MTNTPRLARTLRCLLVIGSFALIPINALMAATDPVDPAANLYETHCATCHNGAFPKAPHTDFLKMLAGDAIFNAMNNGVMQEQAKLLDKNQKLSVAEYLAGPFGDLEAPPSAPLCSTSEAGFDFDKPPAFSAWGMDAGNNRLIPDEVGQLSDQQIRTLKPAWVFAFPNAQRVRSQPAFAGGSLFIGSQDGTVYALNAKTGCIRWRFRASAEVRTGIVTAAWKLGDKAAKPRIYFADLLGRVYANDAVTGENIWIIKVEDHPNVTVTASPALAGNKLLVSVSSLEVVTAADPNYACCTFRGSVVALNTLDGSVLWRSYTIPKIPILQGKTSKDTYIFGPSGAPVWNTPVVDMENGRAYFGSGENYSSPADGNSDAVFAISLETGERLWHFQATANDAWNVACMLADKSNCPAEDGPDLDFGAALMLVGDDSNRRLIAGQKSGMVWAIDPESGNVLWNKAVGRGGIQAGIHFGMSAMGPDVFIPIADWNDDKEHERPARPGLFSLKVADGSTNWYTPHENRCGELQFCDPGVSAPSTSTPNAIFTGSMDGVLRAYAPKTGEVTWEFETNTEFAALGGGKAHGGSMGGGAGPMVYDGMLYATSGYGLYAHMPGNALIAFAPEPAVESKP